MSEARRRVAPASGGAALRELRDERAAAYRAAMFAPQGAELPPSSSSRLARAGGTPASSPFASLRRFLAKHRFLLSLLATLAVLILTRPGAASFAAYVRHRRDRVAMGLGRASRAFLESAIGLDARVRSYGVVAFAEHAGEPHVGLLLSWFPLPPTARAAIQSLDPSDPGSETRAFAALCLLAAVGADVVLAAEGAARHLACPPSLAALRARPHAPIASLFYHRTSRDVLSVLAVCHVAYPDLQALLGRGRAAAVFLLGGACANVAAAWFVAWFARVGGASAGRVSSSSAYVPPPWAPRGPYAHGAHGAVCAVLGCLAAAAREGGGWRGGLFAGFQRRRRATWAVFGAEVDASRALFATLAVRALGGLGDVRAWSSGVGAAMGWYARCWNVV